MASLIGINTRTGGIKGIPSRVGLYTNGVGLGEGEQHPDTITIVRDTRVFPDGEAPPDWRTYDGSNWSAFGAYWYSERTAGNGNLKSAWYQNPANYYQITNEQGGGEGADVAGNYEQLVKVERAIMQAANADGRKCAVLNLAGGSPGDFEIWKAICAPFIFEAWETGGNLYGRHCYADWFVEDDGRVNNGQPARVIAELEYLRSIGYGGGMVLTECGLYGGYGVADYDYFEQQITRWEQVLRPYADMFIGLAWWELGASEFQADYTAHLKQLLPYIQAGDLPRWTPPTQPPNNEEPPMTQKDIEVTITTELPGQPVQIRGWDKATGRRVKYFQYRWMYHDGTGITYTGWKTLPLPTEIADLRGIEAMPVHDFTVTKTVTVECPDEPLDPKPPPVVLTLPQGSKGVDVSYWQGSFNWDDSGAQFGIIRCSDGLTANTTTHDGNGIDRQFFANAEKLTALGIPWAIYHFLRPGNIQAQADKVLAALAVLAGDDMPPKTAVFDNGVKFPAVWIDVEDGALSNAHVQDFYNLLAAKHHTGVYTGKPIWEQVTAGAAVWWSAVPLWITAYGINDGNVPPWPDGPFLPRGWDTAVLWQYSSNPIDQNIVGPYPATANQPDPPTPPTGKTVDFSPYLMPAPGNIGPFLVFEKASGGTIDHQVQVQNGIVYVVKRAAVGTEYEEMRISNGFIERRYDTSPADGLPYKLDDGYGWSKWMPVSMTEGQYYKRAPRVTKYDVGNNCQLVADQGISESYIYFAKYHDSYTLQGGVVKTAVCELHWLWSPGGTVLERYFVAPGKWYIQWGNGDALHYLNEEPQGRAPLPLSPVACLG